ncbi:DUF6011 domain-containing protein [Peterkaempfera sp. SMS 1(5)a]|uniref:DUF6011 domain-containing protein n=1 Tax=Peterkaempfera podocarpi TaxID=3232308 RepID=UPI00366A9031
MSATTEHTNCLRCGRTLTSTTSRTTGYGPTCRAKVRNAQRTADLTDYKPAQIDSARELIEDGAIIPLRPRIYRAVSSDGTETYLTARQGCTCPAGIKGRNCYHRAAVAILTAA